MISNWFKNIVRPTNFPTPFSYISMYEGCPEVTEYWNSINIVDF